MTREIILVEMVIQDDLSTEKNRAFTDPDKAENYFRQLIIDLGTNDEEELACYIDQGFADIETTDGWISINTKTITFEED